MNNIYNTISVYVSDLNLSSGETKRTNCPNCGGYKTFTATNNMGSLLWNCYKASCGIKGGNRTHLSAEDIRISLTGERKVSEATFVLPECVVHHTGHSRVTEWCSKWGIDADDLDLRYDVREDRVVFPVVHDGVLVDAVGRSLGKRLPKWKRYSSTNHLPYASGSGSVAIVVEDCVSSAVVGFGPFVGVALLGTSLQEAHKRFLSQFSTAIVALDPDALTKTLSIAKELRGYVTDVRVLNLKDDLKYRNPTDMENLHGIITN